MWTTFSNFFSIIPTFKPQYDGVTVLVMFRAFRQYPICWIGPKWFGLQPRYNNTQLVSQPPQPWPPPAKMAPLGSTWGLALRANALDGWVTTPWASGYNFGGSRVCMALKVLLCSGNDALSQLWSVLRAIHTLNIPKIISTCLVGCQHLLDTSERSARPHVGC